MYVCACARVVFSANRFPCQYVCASPCLRVYPYMCAALTRARRLVVVVGSQQAISAALKDRTGARRCSLLPRLRSAAAHAGVPLCEAQEFA